MAESTTTERPQDQEKSSRDEKPRQDDSAAPTPDTGKPGAQPQGNPKQGDDKPGKPPFKWTPLKIIGLIVAVIVIAILLIFYLIYASRHESTDDAYTTGHIHNISARVDANVIDVLVDDNERVVAGQVLVRLDPRDYQVRVDQAQANYNRAKSDYDRVQALKGDIAISAQDYDQSRATMEVNKAMLEDALDQLSYCTITSPTDGFIGRKTVEVGNRVTVGGALMAVVQDCWVVGNFKETQLGHMRVGQRAKIQIDALPDHVFQGSIQSFAPGSGATFALLPPDNATGNFTKIVQRLPVKILFDSEDIRGFENRLVPGLSCEVTIDLPSAPQSNPVRN